MKKNSDKIFVKIFGFQTNKTADFNPRALIVMPIIFAVLFFSCVLFAEEFKTELTLKDAVVTALKNNNDIQIQEKEILAAEAGVLGTKSGFLPNVSLNASYNYNDKVFGQPNIFTGYKNDNKAGISVTQPVYNGGANIANARQAELNLKAAEEALLAKKLDVEFETRRLFYGLLFAYENERIAQELLNQAELHYTDAQDKFSQGVVSKFDVLESKVQVSKVVPELVKAQNSSRLIDAEFKKLLGLKSDESIKINGALDYTLLKIREEEFLKQAYLNKPEMILKALNIDIRKWQIETAKSGARPQVNALANYNLRADNPTEIFNQDNKNWNVGISVTMPIFDGFASKAKVDVAKARYEEAALDEENLSEQIAVDIKKGCMDLTQAKTIIEASKDSIETAKEALRLAKIRFDNGEGTNLEILDAQVSLSQIEQNYSAAVYDYLTAEAFLDRTMGKDFLEEGNNAK